MWKRLLNICYNVSVWKKKIEYKNGYIQKPTILMGMAILWPFYKDNTFYNFVLK
jgi:hypothetical protein